MTGKSFSQSTAQKLQEFLDGCASVEGQNPEGVTRQVLSAAAMQQAVITAAVVDQLVVLNAELGLIRAELERRGRATESSRA